MKNIESSENNEHVKKLDENNCSFNHTNNVKNIAVLKNVLNTLKSKSEFVKYCQVIASTFIIILFFLGNRNVDRSKINFIYFSYTISKIIALHFIREVVSMFEISNGKIKINNSFYMFLTKIFTFINIFFGLMVFGFYIFCMYIPKSNLSLFGNYNYFSMFFGHILFIVFFSLSLLSMIDFLYFLSNIFQHNVKEKNVKNNPVFFTYAFLFYNFLDILTMPIISLPFLIVNETLTTFMCSIHIFYLILMFVIVISLIRVRNTMLVTPFKLEYKADINGTILALCRLFLIIIIILRITIFINNIVYANIYDTIMSSYNTNIFVKIGLYFVFITFSFINIFVSYIYLAFSSIEFLEDPNKAIELINNQEINN
jgi:hypothetical protein